MVLRLWSCSLSLGFVMLAFLLGFSFSSISVDHHSSQSGQQGNAKEFEFDGKTEDNPVRPHRAVVELNGLLNRRTKYTASTLMVGKYGNWCGSQDGSTNDGEVKDGCDKCCKKHKLCYQEAKKIVVMDFLGIQTKCIPYAKVYSITNDLSHPDCIPVDTMDEKCSMATCKCDLAFVECLKEDPCPPF